MREVDELAAAGTLLPTQVSIALHNGEAIVGNVGSAERKEYSVIDDVVSVAFRIEALNKEFDSRLLISEPVRTAAQLGEGERILPSNSGPERFGGVISTPLTLAAGRWQFTHAVEI